MFVGATTVINNKMGIAVLPVITMNNFVQNCRVQVRVCVHVCSTKEALPCASVVNYLHQGKRQRVYCTSLVHKPGGVSPNVFIIVMVWK